MLAERSFPSEPALEAHRSQKPSPLLTSSRNTDTHTHYLHFTGFTGCPILSFASVCIGLSSRSSKAQLCRTCISLLRSSPYLTSSGSSFQSTAGIQSMYKAAETSSEETRHMDSDSIHQVFHFQKLSSLSSSLGSPYPAVLASGQPRFRALARTRMSILDVDHNGCI